MRAGPEQQQGEAFLAVLDIVVLRVRSTYTLAQIGAVSRRCRALCAAHATHQLQALLLPVLRQAAATPHGLLQQQHMGSITYLCNTASRNAFEAASAAVVAVPGVPEAAIHLLTAAGVHVSDAQVMAAVRNKQLGAEVWVLARVAAHGPTADADYSEAELCAALSAISNVATPAANLQAAAPAATAARAQPASLLELVTCYAHSSEGFFLGHVLRFLHPACIPDLLRFAVSQRDVTAAAAIIQHLTAPVAALIAELKHYRHFRQIETGSMQPLVVAHHQQEQQQQQIGLQQQPQPEDIDAEQQAIAQIAHTLTLQQAELTPQLLNELLLLAAARGSSRLILQLLDAGSQQLPAATVASLLRYAIGGSSGGSCDSAARELLLNKVRRLPAASQLNADQICSLYLEAVKRTQLVSVKQLCMLPGVQQLSTDQAHDVVLAAMQRGWLEGLRALTRVRAQLHPDEVEVLLQKAVLWATLGGDGMPQPWCDVRMQEHKIIFPASTWQDGLKAVELLCSADAAADLEQEQVAELLFTAAELGNGLALRTLLGRLPNIHDVETEVVEQLLEVAVQFRHGGMLSAVASYFQYKLKICSRLLLQEAATSLLRTDDRQLLVQLINVLLVSLPNYAVTGLPQLLQLAVRLGRSGAIRSLYSQVQCHAPRLRDHQLPLAEVEALLRLAAHSNSGSMVQSLLLLPGAAGLPGGGLQLVMDECRRQGPELGIPPAKASWLWPPQPQQQLQQHSQQQQAARQHFDHQSVGLPSAGSSGVQQEQELPPPQKPQLELLRMLPLVAMQRMLHATQAGQLPDEHAYALLPPGSAVDEEAMDAGECAALTAACKAAEQLLHAALQLQPGQQQQTWVELLARSQVAQHFNGHQQQRLLTAAVDAAHISGCYKPMQELCCAWQPLCFYITGYVCAAAVQLPCLPALRCLLRMPTSRGILGFQVADLMRWAICSNISSRSSSSNPVTNTDSFMDPIARTWRPVAPGCSAPQAEVLAAVCRLPEAQQLTRHCLVGLLVRAMQQGNVEAVQQLCGLGGAAALDTDCVRGLLRWARVVGSRPGRDAVVGALCGLKGAKGLKIADVSKALQLYDKIDDMMGWNAAESEQAGVMPAEVQFAELASGAHIGTTKLCWVRT